MRIQEFPRKSVVLGIIAGFVVFFLGCPGSQAPRDAGKAPTDAACRSGAGAPGEACGCDGACVGEAQCVQTGAPFRRLNVCTSVSAGVCVCGVSLDDRCRNGALCVCPSGGDDNGVCVTLEERAVLCSGALATSFNCDGSGLVDAAPGTVP